MSKLYSVNLTKEVTYSEVREIVKEVNSLCLVNVIVPGKIYEVQDRKVAEKIAEIFGGEIKIIDYNIKNFLK